MTTETTTAIAYGFDNETFEQELDMASQGGQSKATFKATPGMKTTFAKAGVFNQVIGPDPRNAQKKITRQTDALEGIIVDAMFERQFWGKDGNGKDKIICQTISHKLHADDEARSGKGKWQIPYYGDLNIQKYDPMGSRGISCAECIRSGQHGKPCGELTGEKGCNAKGTLILIQTATDGGLDKNNNPIGMEPRPQMEVVNIQTPETSGIEFQQYVKTLRNEGRKVNEVITHLGIQPTRNGMSNMLKLSFTEPATAEQIAQAKHLYETAVQEIEAERKKRAEERKAKNGGGNAGKGAQQDAGIKDANDDQFSF